jgi:hypothetical protein
MYTNLSDVDKSSIIKYAKECSANIDRYDVKDTNHIQCRNLNYILGDSYEIKDLTSSDHNLSLILDYINNDNESNTAIDYRKIYDTLSDEDKFVIDDTLQNLLQELKEKHSNPAEQKFTRIRRIIPKPDTQVRGTREPDYRAPLVNIGDYIKKITKFANDVNSMDDVTFQDNLDELRLRCLSLKFNGQSLDEKYEELKRAANHESPKYRARINTLLNDEEYIKFKNLVKETRLKVKRLPVQELYKLAFVQAEQLRVQRYKVNYKSFYKSFGNTKINYITNHRNEYEGDKCPICFGNAFEVETEFEMNDITVQLVAKIDGFFPKLVFEPTFYHFSCVLRAIGSLGVCKSPMTRSKIFGIIGVKPLSGKDINNEQLLSPINPALSVHVDEPPTFKNDVEKAWHAIWARRVAATQAAKNARAIVDARYKVTDKWKKEIERRKRMSKEDIERHKKAAIARKNARFPMPATFKIEPPSPLAHPPSLAQNFFLRTKVHPADASGHIGTKINQVAPLQQPPMPGGRKASSRRLESRSVEELKAIAKTRRVNVKGLKKQEIIDKLRRRTKA